MKAIVCTKFGLPSELELLDVPKLEPKAKEVLIQINTASVNFPDTLIIQGLYQFKPPLPFTPGSDVAGTVLKVGEGVKHLKAGDAVFGTAMTGAFAEEVVVPVANCFPKPPMLEDGIAASFMIAYGTSMHALKDRAKLQTGETLLVLGAAGGVGLSAVEIGKVMGATVIAAASTDEKLALCKEYGATHTINYTTENLKERVKELTKGKGVDVIYDPVGGDYSEAALRAMGWNGRFLVVGFASGTIPKIPLNLPLLKSCQIVGVFWGSFAQQFPSKNMANVMQLLQWYAEGKIKPHIHQRYSLEDTPKALEAILNREVRGKVVIDIAKK
jgi:NADPH2:quinone reductase